MLQSRLRTVCGAREGMTSVSPGLWMTTWSGDHQQSSVTLSHAVLLYLHLLAIPGALLNLRKHVLPPGQGGDLLVMIIMI